MANEVKESDFTFIHPRQLNGVRDGQVQVLGDRWWVMRGDEIAFYRGKAPQCNTNRKVTESIAQNYEWCTEIRFIARVLVPTRQYANGWDYCLPKSAA